MDKSLHLVIPSPYHPSALRWLRDQQIRHRLAGAHLLHFQHMMIMTTSSIKLGVRTLFDDLSIAQDDDVVGVLGGGQPMSNQNRRAPFHNGGNRRL